jgi:riboflavin kinase/FMN adenylyltransferase
VTIKVTDLWEAENRPRHVAIGTFDGVHLGHQAVIDHADTVLTFDPHPLSVLRPEAVPPLIAPFSIRRDVLDGIGVEELVVIPFDEEFSQLGPEEFIDRVLIEQLGAKKVSVGENFHFGAKAKGSPAMLADRPEFETRIVPLIEIDGGTVSSSRIREQIESGRGGMSSASLPPTSSLTSASLSPATASMRPSPMALRRRSTSASARPSTRSSES